MSARAIIACVPLFLFVSAAAAQQPEPAPAPAPASPAAGESEDLQDRVARLERQVRDQEQLIDRLEASRGRLTPATALGWFWLATGLVGEFVFFLRFLVQWIASERRRRTVVPTAFWHLSLIGTAMVLAYAVYRIDPVFILAYSLNVFLYVRNLVIARRSPELEAVAEKTSE